MEQIYTIIAILALILLFGLIVIARRKKSKQKLSSLASLAFIFIFTGIIFSDNRWLGYTLMTIGGLIALFDIIKKSKKQ